MVDLLARLRNALAREVASLAPRRVLANVLLAMLPAHAFENLRVAVIRLGGYTGVPHNATISGRPRLVGPPKDRHRLVFGDRVYVNIGCLFDVTSDIHIGDNVAIGQQVAILTETHHMGNENARATDRVSYPVTIGSGCWIGARATILPGVTIGPGAVVGAGSLVNRDVAPNVVVAGVPARVVRELEPEVGNPT